MSKDELMYKIESVIKYLEENNGYEHKVYNHLCPGCGEPDSNIVEYAKDVKDMVEVLIEEKEDDDYLPKSNNF